jgi:hypothetical protein
MNARTTAPRSMTRQISSSLATARLVPRLPICSDNAASPRKCWNARKPPTACRGSALRRRMHAGIRDDRPGRSHRASRSCFSGHALHRRRRLPVLEWPRPQGHNVAGGNATAMKQATEFGLAQQGIAVVPMSFQNVDIKAVRLPVAQGDLACARSAAGGALVIEATADIARVLQRAQQPVHGLAWHAAAAGKLQRGCAAAAV